jgi:hypothetical protein
MATLTLSVVPLGDTPLLATAIAHWLFCNVVAEPSAADIHVVPLSFSKLMEFVARA